MVTKIRSRLSSKALFAATAVSFLLGMAAFAQTRAKPGTKNNVEVVLDYPFVHEWVDKAANMPAQERNLLFQQVALEPILDKCFPKATQDQAMSQLEQTIGNPSDWDLTLVKNEITELEGHTSQLTSLIKSAVAESEKKLPSSHPITVCGFYFSPYWGPYRERFNGSMGFTPSGTTVRLFLAPVGDWLHWVQNTTAHEYHHAASMQLNPGITLSKLDLLSSLVFEGRADHFARIVTGFAGPWTTALTSRQECEIFRGLLPQLHESKISWYVLNNARAGQFPDWAGYTIGYRIVAAYLQNHPHASIEGWSLLSPSSLFEESKYGGGCEQSH